MVDIGGSSLRVSTEIDMKLAEPVVEIVEVRTSPSVPLVPESNIDVLESNTDIKIGELETLAVLFDRDIEIKSIMTDFMLITYDIPSSKEGMKARADFLRTARRFGVVQHTESVYYAPWTTEANVAVTKLAGKGKVYVWRASVTDETQARYLTKVYDLTLMKWIEGISERLMRMREHVSAAHAGRAKKMLKVTAALVDGLNEAVTTRNDENLSSFYAAMEVEYQAVRNLVDFAVLPSTL